MRKKTIKNIRNTVAFIAVGLILFVGARESHAPTSPEVKPPETADIQSDIQSVQMHTTQSAEFGTPQGEEYTVVRTIDGDTIVVNIGGADVTVRLIGLDTPETVHPTKPVQCFGKEASAYMKSLLTGKEVYIATDSTQDTYDKYGRLLAYVYLGDILINEKMIRDGYGFEYTYFVPYQHQVDFKNAEVTARQNKAGLWADGVCEEGMWRPSFQDATPQPEFDHSRAVPQEDTDEYICSYNAYNCSDFSSHAEAQHAYESCGGPDTDIHYLDVDADGQACERLE